LALSHLHVVGFALQDAACRGEEKVGVMRRDKQTDRQINKYIR